MVSSGNDWTINIRFFSWKPWSFAFFSLILYKRSCDGLSRKLTIISPFLGGAHHLYMLLSPSVRPSVRPSVCPSNRRAQFSKIIETICHCISPCNTESKDCVHAHSISRVTWKETCKQIFSIGKRANWLI